MSYQVTLNSRNVLVPVSLEGPDGSRLDAPPSRHGTATAMVISVSAGGAFSQEFIPLNLVPGPAEAYAGEEWELRSQRAGRDHWVFYLGIPDSRFAAAAPGAGPSPGDPKSLSVQVIGSSPLTGREDFAGGVDVSMRAEVALPLVPGFLSLGERFFPTLLPHNFVERHALGVFDLRGRRDLVLMASLQADPGADRVPVSFGKHWDPKNWVGAVVENLAGAPGAYHVIRGGCFYGRNHRVTHWFGGGIGLEDADFRRAAAERIRALGPSGRGAWVFWLEPQGAGLPSPEELASGSAAGPARFSIRHPMLHRMLRRRAPAAVAAAASIGSLPAEAAVAALSRVARILADHQGELHRARTEPAHDRWSEQALGAVATVAGALGLAGSAGPVAPAPAPMPAEAALEAAIRDLYRSQGEALRTLESAFDETSGYTAWDAPRNPLRQVLSDYLAGGPEARSPA